LKLETPIVAIGEILWDLLPTGPRAGGAPFNFAFHCHQLGHPALMVSRVGDDDLGRKLRAEVCRLGMSDEHIQTDPVHPTGTVTVQLDAAGQPTYSITEDVAWDFLEWNEQLVMLAQDEGNFGQGQIAQVLCYGTLAQRNPVTRETIRNYWKCIRPKTWTICDVNLRPPFVSKEVVAASIARADWVKVSHSEVDDVLGLLEDERANQLSAGGTVDATSVLYVACHRAVICLTRGARGCRIRWTESDSFDAPGIRAGVADTVGAGDAFTAALVCRGIEGVTLQEAARFANAYAAVVVSKPGGTPSVTRAEVERLL
jgi:fructokinase